MANENEKSGFFQRFTGNNKSKKGSCCCRIELEEIPEGDTEKRETGKKEKKNSCRG